MVTTQIKGPEALERAVATTLATYLPAELTAIWAAWATYDTTDAITVPLVNPAQVVAGRLTELTDFPTVMVVSDSGHQRTNGAPTWGELDNQLVVMVFLVGDDIHTLDKMTKRYLQAVWEVLMKNQSMDGTYGFTGIDPLDYGREPPSPLKDAPGLMQMGGWTFMAHTADTTSQA